MKKVVLFMLVMLSFNVFGQPEVLKKELVKVDNGKFIINDYTMLSNKEGNNLQVKAYGVSKADDYISRDQFVAVFYMVLSELFKEFTDAGYKTEDVEEIIGNPDILINIYMAKSGIQIELITDKGKQRFTKKWNEIIN